MRIARILRPSSLRPSVALVRDGAVYDVAELESTSARAFPAGFDREDFQTRVVALRMANFLELDAALIQGKRPSSARVHDPVFLPPFDVDRATYVHVDTRGLADKRLPAVRLGHARQSLGQNAIVGFDANETRPEIEVSLGILVGERLDGESGSAIEKAILGYTLVIDWVGLDFVSTSSSALSTTRSLRPQVGPVLVPSMLHRDIGASAIRVVVGGQRHEAGFIGDVGLTPHAAVSVASRVCALNEGDLVVVGPLSRGTGLALGAELSLHDEVAIESDVFGTLRGIPVLNR